MRKVVLVGFVLACVTAISFLTVSPVERRILNPEGTITATAPAKPMQVQVTNFPAVQAVNGTVNVGNLPAVQQVEVVNLPPPAVCPGQVHFVGFTTALLDSTVLNNEKVFVISRACNLEFPSARACEVWEFYNLIPPPTFPMGEFLPLRVWLTSLVSGQTQQGRITTMDHNGAVGYPGTPGMFPVACCGF